MAKKNNADFLDQVAGGREIERPQTSTRETEVTYTIHPNANLNNPENDPLVMVGGELMNRSIMDSGVTDTISRRIYRTPRHEFLERYPNIEVYGNPPLGLN